MTCTRSPQGTVLSRAVADDTLGEIVVRRLSRRSGVVAGVRPYIRTMYPPSVAVDNAISAFARFLLPSPRITNSLRRFESGGSLFGV
jgi:hypothetical protein